MFGGGATIVKQTGSEWKELQILKKRKRMEYDAYEAEIQLAESIGHPEIELIALHESEIEKIEHGTRFAEFD